VKLIQNIILIIHQHGFNFIDAKMDGGECQKGSEGTGQNDIDKVKLMSNDPVPSDKRTPINILTKANYGDSIEDHMAIQRGINMYNYYFK